MAVQSGIHTRRVSLLHLRKSNAERHDSLQEITAGTVQCYANDQKHWLAEFTRTSSHKSTHTHVSRSLWSYWHQFYTIAEQRTPTRRTNSKNCFRNIRANKNCYRSSFLPRSIPEWNNLPDQVRNAVSVDSFKSFLTSNVNFEKLLSFSHYYD